MTDDGWTDVRHVDGYLIGTDSGYMTVGFLKRFYPGTTATTANIGSQAGVALFSAQSTARANAVKVSQAMATTGLSVKLPIIHVTMREQIRILNRPIDEIEGVPA